jgi:hypothetical protein
MEQAAGTGEADHGGRFTDRAEFTTEFAALVTRYLEAKRTDQKGLAHVLAAREAVHRNPTDAARRRWERRISEWIHGTLPARVPHSGHLLQIALTELGVPSAQQASWRALLERTRHRRETARRLGNGPVVVEQSTHRSSFHCCSAATTTWVAGCSGPRTHTDAAATAGSREPALLLDMPDHRLAVDLTTPVAVREAVGALVHRVHQLPDGGADDPDALLAACRTTQDLIRLLTGHAENDANLAASCLNDLVPVVESLCRTSDLALPLQADLVPLYGAVRDYQGAIAQALHTIALPGRRASTADLLQLGTMLMNACEFEPAQRVLAVVSEQALSGGPMSPPTPDERFLQQATADCFRRMWIPHGLGHAETVIQNHGELLARVRGTDLALEAGVLHRLGRAYTDLGRQRRDASLLAHAERIHRRAISTMRGGHNFFMPMALYYSLSAQRLPGRERVLAETRELSAGLSEGAQAHIELLNARCLGGEGRLYSGIEAAGLAIEMWQRHPHPTGAVDALVTRAALRYQLSTSAATDEATTDLIIARRLARSRGFDLQSADQELLRRCTTLLDPGARHRIADAVRTWEAEHPALSRRPGPELQQLLARLEPAFHR